MLAEDAFDRIIATGLDELVEPHAAVICLTGERRPGQTLHSFALTRLPATVFTDHTGDAASSPTSATGPSACQRRWTTSCWNS
ncbi:hypothetical protein [Streptomyces coffeae]|uniref:Uncharacterized protein n=1 Tax=Streptomyces coffeae TaxID=621382 RepID=A0ABS1NI82_9ACTN|nr:hypothetical protein [Streptomyces coffeae]MBL1099491.1 hypothetical protein [Streptomyces coffeae]